MMEVNDPYRHAPHDAESAREMRRALVERMEQKSRRRDMDRIAVIWVATPMIVLSLFAITARGVLGHVAERDRSAYTKEPMRPGFSVIIANNSTAWASGAVSGLGSAAFGWECVDKSQTVMVRMTKSEATCSSADAGAADAGTP